MFAAAGRRDRVLRSSLPERLLDARTSTGPVAGYGKISFQVKANANGIPNNVAGVWVNLTVTEAKGNG